MSHLLLAGLLLLVACRPSVGRFTIDLPYYTCVRNDNAAVHEPGICSTFETKYIVLQANAASFGHHEAATLCRSREFDAVNAAMSMATIDWSTDGCIGYVTEFVNNELQSRVMEKLTSMRHHKFEERLKDHYASIDGITDAFGAGQWVEGNIHRFQKNDSEEEIERLARKRRCLLTALSVAVPWTGGSVAEIGFNAGHSAASILTALPTAHLTSFDICSW